MEAQTALAVVDRAGALEKSYARKILRLHPGLGDKSIGIANSLADSGLSPGLASMLMLTVYSPPAEGGVEIRGLGQGTRMRWFTDAVRSRYGHKLDKIRDDYRQFRMMLADLEDAVEMRDTLVGEGYSFSFHEAFLLWELGQDAESVLGMISDMAADGRRDVVAKRHIVKAAQMVKAGRYMELQTALDDLNRGYNRHDY